MADVIEVDAATGEAVARPFTKGETAQRKADSTAELAKATELAGLADQRAAILTRLGLTEDDLAVLLTVPVP